MLERQSRAIPELRHYSMKIRGNVGVAASVLNLGNRFK
jgi:hypothetical protein